MRNTIHFGLACLVAVIALGVSTATAAPYTTAGAPPSSITLEIWLGPPGYIDEEDEDASSILLATIGPQSVNGTASATVAVDGFGDGSLTFDWASLGIEDITGEFVDLDVLGGVYLDFVSVLMNIMSTAIPVVGNAWNLDDIGAPDSLTLALDSGLVNLYDFEGPIAELVGDTVIDLNEDPVAVDIDGLLGYGIGGVASPGAISIVFPAIDLELLEQLVFIRLTGEVNLVVVPEPSTFAMLGMGVVGLGLAIARRRR